MQKKVLTVMAVLLLAVMVLSATTQNVVSESRKSGSYEVIEYAECEKKKDADAPIGVVQEWSFILDMVTDSDTLAFYMNHHNIEVYLGEESAYQMTASERAIRTPGGVWVMIPLRVEDTGKEVRIELSPLYENYQEEVPEIMLGSELAIYRDTLQEALPELLLSMCVVFAGIFLLSLAIWHHAKRHFELRLYAIGMLAVSAGLWRFTYAKVTYLLIGNQSVFLYNLSIISLMLVASSLLNIAEVKYAKYWNMVYCAVYSVQFILQLAGVCDLRQMLQITHLTIILSAVLLCMRKLNTSWMLGAGVLIDLLLYYFAETSSQMLFTLGVILCYSMLEGIRFFISYMRQKKELEEMETKLTLSRTATMMSQIRSHFVFNLLNAISGMCKYDPEKADDTIVRFARYLRNNIDIMEDDKNIPFAVDLKQLEDYVVLEQVRFGDKLEFYTDIETDQFMIPPLILQPVVENAIKHGVSKKMGNGTIILRTRDMGDSIVITVEDDGVGFAMEELEKEKSVGIRNIRFRLKHLVNGSMEIASQVGVGTTVTIRIPKEG